MYLFQKKYIGETLILILIFSLFSIGLLMLYSATHGITSDYSYLFLKQVTGMICGVIIIIFISQIPYKTIIAWGMCGHYLTLVLLLITLAIGYTAMGAQRWLNLGFIKFQPSELAKVTLPLWVVHYFLTEVIAKPTYHNWIHVISMIIVTALLIIKQPDLGSGLVVGASGMILLYIMGLPNKIIVQIILLIGLMIPIAWHNLHDYQKKRILVFLGNGSVHKERYQLEQSKIAVGSGGFYGKGFLKGTQKNFNFLPEFRTDFIFAVLAEEFGFLGCITIIILYTFLLMRFVVQCMKINDYYAFILSCGLISPLMISIICNIGMVIGLLPIVGIPLPCISYGVTHIWGTCFTIGIINSILSSSD
jgi:rod shape determining protein RodA